jgi:prepilin-type N-terminal cleavage/methylation domain-containing protein
MSLNNINKERGFTIVELLIVIVVIGILAAITIVAYNGVQNRARTTTAQANAEEVQRKSEVYAADAGNGSYPSLAQLTGATDTAALSTKVKALVRSTAPSAATPADKDAIHYVPCSTTGAKIGYWSSVANAPVYISSGTAATSNDAVC